MPRVSRARLRASSTESIDAEESERVADSKLFPTFGVWVLCSQLYHIPHPFKLSLKPFFSNGLHDVIATPMIVRDTLDNGIRLVTESMGHVRSVSLGVWLTSK